MTKHTKPKIFVNTFERLEDQTKHTGTGVIKAVTGADEFKDLLYGKSDTSKKEPVTEAEKKTVEEEKEFQRKVETSAKDGKHTPLDIEAMQKKHHAEREDKAKEDAIRKRLFNLVKQDEIETRNSSKQKEHDKEQVEQSEEQQKQKELEEKKRMQNQGAAPEGKVARGGLFAKKKKRSNMAVAEQQPEMRGSGKH